MGSPQCHLSHRILQVPPRLRPQLGYWKLLSGGQAVEYYARRLCLGDGLHVWVCAKADPCRIFGDRVGYPPDFQLRSQGRLLMEVLGRRRGLQVGNRPQEPTLQELGHPVLVQPILHFSLSDISYHGLHRAHLADL